MEARRVGMIVVVALVVLALLGTGVQSMLHQQWMEGFAVGQAAVAQGNGVPPAALVPYAYGAMNHRGPGHIFFPLLAIAFFFIIMRRIMFRHMWRAQYRMNGGTWGQPGAPTDAQAWTQGDLPPWVRPWGPRGWGHHGCGGHGWGRPEDQTQSQPAQPSITRPAPGNQGPQAPVDL